MSTNKKSRFLLNLSILTVAILTTFTSGNAMHDDYHGVFVNKNCEEMIENAIKKHSDRSLESALNIYYPKKEDQAKIPWNAIEGKAENCHDDCFYHGKIEISQKPIFTIGFFSLWGLGASCYLASRFNMNDSYLKTISLVVGTTLLTTGSVCGIGFSSVAIWSACQQTPYVWIPRLRPDSKTRPVRSFIKTHRKI
ncbi:MAG: hypothetical protein WC707_00975 [Candidatus Babeliaceae bacterium]|jgi:hypothetical protein